MSRSARAGFTLLEMLITLMAGSLLLACLWSLLGMYSRMFNVGSTKAASAQLLTGISQQITDDLHNAILDGGPPLPGVPGPAHRFGLFGDAHTLQIDVLQTTWRRDSLGTVGGGAAYGPDLPLVPQAHELRTVRYSFVDPEAATEPGAEVRAGLSRREFDFETPYDKNGALGAVAAAIAAATAPAPDAEGSSDEISMLGGLPVADDDDSVAWMPEVVGLEFQYFDGSGWSGSWNSLQQKSLPVAVEVNVTLRLGDKPARRAAADSTATETSPQARDPSLPGAAPAAAPGTITRRFVIHLPGSSLRTSFDAAPPGDLAMEDDPAPESDQPDPASSLLDETMPGDDLTVQQNLLADPSAGGAGTKSRFRVGRRSPRPPPDQSATSSPTPAESWMRMGP